MNSDKDKICLLITSCVKPPENVYYLHIVDENERRRQYVESVEYYIKHSCFEKLIYCDNSSEAPNENLIKLASDYKKELEWLSFPGDEDKCVKKGKGYGEGEIIDYALKNSRLIKQSDYFVKVTGRILVHNSDALIEQSEPDNELYINLFKDDSGAVYADTRFYISRIETFRAKLAGLYKNVDDRVHMNIERLFGDSIQSGNIEQELLPDQPSYDGFSGSSGLRLIVDKYEMDDYETMRKEMIDGRYYPYKWMYHEMRYLPKEDDLFHALIKNSNVALYGAGKVGRLFFRSFCKWCNISHWVDGNFDGIKSIYDKPIESPDALATGDQEIIVVAIVDRNTVDDIYKLIKQRDKLLCDNLLWFDGNSFERLD